VPTPPDDSPMGTRLAQLARAGELRSAGVLTDEEFATTKAAILSA
jgi:hypothetical protein